MSDQIESPLPECCQEPLKISAKPPAANNSVNVKMVEVIGASFLGLISLILLVLLIFSQRRNRYLTVELAKRAPRLALLNRPHKRGVSND